MIPRILGAILILTGCSGFGMMVCLSYKKEEEMLKQMIHAMDFIQCELQFRMTPLPDLCEQAGTGCKGKISHFWLQLSAELGKQESANVSDCVEAAKNFSGVFPPRMDKFFEILSLSLGQFDAQGQLQALEAARCYCRGELESMGINRENRLRSYQTLGICTGVALVILLV